MSEPAPLTKNVPVASSYVEWPGVPTAPMSKACQPNGTLKTVGLEPENT